MFVWASLAKTKKGELGKRSKRSKGVPGWNVKKEKTHRKKEWE